MKTTTLVLIGFAITIASLLQAQTILTGNDVAVAVAQVTGTDSSPAQMLSPVGIFYSAQNPSQPCTPVNPSNFFGWDLGHGQFLLDDPESDRPLPHGIGRQNGSPAPVRRSLRQRSLKVILTHCRRMLLDVRLDYIRKLGLERHELNEYEDKKSLQRKSLFMLIGCLILAPVCTDGDSPGNRETLLERVRGLDKMTDAERESLLSDNYWNQRQIEQVLVQNLSSTNPEVKIYSAFFLGVYRYPEAAQPLASMISFKDEVRANMPWRNGLPPMGINPAMTALMRIGTPSIAPVIQNLEESDDSKVRECSLDVLNYIDHDKDITRLRFEKALKAEKNPQKQARLQAAIKMLGATN